MRRKCFTDVFSGMQRSPDCAGFPHAKKRKHRTAAIYLQNVRIKERHANLSIQGDQPASNLVQKEFLLLLATEKREGQKTSLSQGQTCECEK